jgi:tetratricopeptide (TPR) repeat protein
MGQSKEDALREIRELVSRNDLKGAVARYVRLLEASPHDWASVNALGDLYLRIGDIDSAARQFTRAADHFREEGFLPKAGALYRKILKLRHDDSTLLNLVETLAEQGLLAEARQHVLALAQKRREQGDSRGADECLARLEALAAHAPARGASKPASPADSPLAAPSAAASPAAVRQQTTAPEIRTAPEPESSTTGPAAPATDAPTLEAVFEGLRARVQQEPDLRASIAQFDRAQQRLNDGDDAGAMADLRAAAGAPPLRFKALAQLGRLYLSRGALHDGIGCLERAADGPSDDAEAISAVLYDLADAVERSGSAGRALALFKKLEVHMSGYRDVRARIARLRASDAGSPGR